MIIAVELYKIRNMLFDQARKNEADKRIRTEDILIIDDMVKEVMDELERREESSGRREQSREISS